jgi:hypothetical protein
MRERERERGERGRGKRLEWSIIIFLHSTFHKGVYVIMTEPVFKALLFRCRWGLGWSSGYCRMGGRCTDGGMGTKVQGLRPGHERNVWGAFSFDPISKKKMKWMKKIGKSFVIQSELPSYVGTCGRVWNSRSSNICVAYFAIILIDCRTMRLRPVFYRRLGANEQAYFDRLSNKTSGRSI